MIGTRVFGVIVPRHAMPQHRAQVIPFQGRCAAPLHKSLRLPGLAWPTGQAHRTAAAPPWQPNTTNRSEHRCPRTSCWLVRCHSERIRHSPFSGSDDPPFLATPRQGRVASA